MDSVCACLSRPGELLLVANHETKTFYISGSGTRHTAYLLPADPPCHQYVFHVMINIFCRHHHLFCGFVFTLLRMVNSANRDRVESRKALCLAGRDRSDASAAPAKRRTCTPSAYHQPHRMKHSPRAEFLLTLHEPHMPIPLAYCSPRPSDNALTTTLSTGLPTRSPRVSSSSTPAIPNPAILPLGRAVFSISAHHSPRPPSCPIPTAFQSPSPAAPTPSARCDLSRRWFSQTDIAGSPPNVDPPLSPPGCMVKEDRSAPPPAPLYDMDLKTTVAEFLLVLDHMSAM